MVDLAELLDRTTPEDLPSLDRCDQVDLARRARRRTRWHRALVSGCSLLAVVALAIAAITTADGRDDSGAEVAATWAGPGGEPLDEPVGSWTRAEDPPFSSRHSAFAGTLGDGRVLVWGGQAGTATPTDGGIYDPSTGEWEPIPPAPLGSDLQFGYFHDEIQLAGDRLAIMTTDIRRPRGEANAVVYDVARGEWTTSPVVDLGNDPISVAPVAWDGETLALLPQPVGVDIHYDAATWRWTFGEDTWQQGTPAPIGLRTGAGTAFDGRRLAVWSGSVNGRLQSDGAIYDVPTDSWELIPDAPISGAEYPLVAWLDGRVVVSPSVVNAPVPGEQFHDVGDLAIYDPVTDGWDTAPRVPDFRPNTAYPYLTRNGAVYVPPDRSSTDPTAGRTVYLVYPGSAATTDDAREPRFLRSDEWERAPYDGLFRLGAFTVAVSGLDSPGSCCHGPLSFDVRVRVAADQWLEAAATPFPMRIYETVVATGDKLVVIGGAATDEDGNAEEAVGDVWIFDLAG